MSNFCPNCGVELIKGTKFCSACGKKVEQQPMTHIQSLQQQQNEQQTSVPLSPPKKSKKKLIIGILAISIAVVIVLIIILFLLGGTGSFSGADSRFVGEWEQDIGLGAKFDWKFNGDSTLETGSSGGAMYNVGTWVAKSDQLCLYNNVVCYSYEFSNNGNTLTLNIYGDSFGYPLNLVLTKKGQQSPGQKNQTPTIACTTASTTDRITIAFTDANIKWKDVVITLDTNSSTHWRIYSGSGINKQTLNTAITDTTIDITVGDYIELTSPYTGNVRVTLRYTPTNSLLGTWTVNV
jgi:hypothetical protein